VVVPAGNECPGRCDFVHVTVQLSVAVGSVQLTGTVHAAAGKVADLFDGQPRMFGGVASLVPGAQHTSPPFLLIILTISKSPDVLPGNSEPQVVPNTPVSIGTMKSI
jgi:hypothetical protein